MFLSGVFGRTPFAAAKSETSAATAAAASVARNSLVEFFEADRSADDGKTFVYGLCWKASEVRPKSWDDLHKLCYVLLKEKNMPMTQRQMRSFRIGMKGALLHAQNLWFPNPEQLPSIKQVLTKGTIEEPDPKRSAEMKRLINAL